MPDIFKSASVLGNIGPELSYTDISVFISSDGGNTWRQVTERFGDRGEIFRANLANISLIYGILSLIVTFCLFKKKIEAAVLFGQCSWKNRWAVG